MCRHRGEGHVNINACAQTENLQIALQIRERNVNVVCIGINAVMDCQLMMIYATENLGFLHSKS